MPPSVRTRLRQVADDVLVATSRRDRTTSTVVLARRGPGVSTLRARALVVDPAWLPGELAALGTAVRGLAAPDGIAGFATHAHHDHVLWPRVLGDRPRYASDETVRLCAAHRDAMLTALTADDPPGAWPAALLDLVGRVTPAPGPLLDVGGRPVELVVTDAHCPGHTSLWLPDVRVLVAGDLLSDVELPLPFGPDLPGADATDVDAHLAGLDALAPYVAQAVTVVPGHGLPTRSTAEGIARLAADRGYLTSVRAGRSSDDPRLAVAANRAVDARLRAALRSRA